MNTRLASLLVAGGLFLAGSQVAPAADVSSNLVLRDARLQSGSKDDARVLLSVPGMSAAPRLQVLSGPDRVVVDLPGVERGRSVSRADLTSLSHPLIRKARLAQFSPAPNAVTRLVLEVAPGTQVELTHQGEEIGLSLHAGQGAVQAHMAPMSAPAAMPSAPAAEREVITAQVQPEAPKAEAAPVAAPVAAAPKVAAKPLEAMPAVASGFQPLPRLALASLPTAKPDLTQTPEPAAAQPAHTAAPAPRSGGRTLGESQSRYHGAKVTIDLPNADIRDFLNILADTGHLNLVMDSDVQGTYHFKFTDTPWDQVLDVILKNAGLGKELDNGVLRVARIEKLQKEEEDRKRLEEAQALAGALETRTRPLSYAKVSEVQKVVKDMMTKRGSVIVDERTNTLIITDLARNIQVLDELINTMDVQIQQVQIEARIVEANKNFAREFGIRWPTANTGDAKLTVGGKDAPWASSSSPSWNSTGYLSKGRGYDTAVGFAPGKDNVTSIAGPAGEFWFSFLSNRFSINAVLQSLETDGIIKIVSSPKVVTQNNRKATILSGEKIPYPTQQGGAAGGAITVAFADANLQLDVTPQITNEGTILMDLKIQKAQADFSRTVNGTPTILQKSLETQVLVRDGGTAVLGGVYVTQDQNGSTGVPFLKKLPIVGFLFRNKIHTENNAELLIFITPRILKS